MEKIKIVIGLGIIVFSFIYIIKNKGSMLDNILRKNKEQYERQQKLKEDAFNVVDGQADAFDTIVKDVKEYKNNIKSEKN